MRRDPARRPRRPTAAEDREAVAERRSRAVEEPLDVRLRTREPFPILEVRNPLHGTGYRVLLPEWPSRSSALCSCTDFARRGLGTCKHLEAGVRWFGDHPDAKLLSVPAAVPRPSTVWREIESRQGSVPPASLPDSLRLRRAGAVLYETSGVARSDR